MHPCHRFLVASFALLVIGVGQSFAFEDPSSAARLEVDRPGWIENEGLWMAKGGAFAAQLKATPLAGLEQRYGGNWHYETNTLTGSLHRVYGSGINYAGALQSDQAAENAARSFVAQNRELFSAGNEDLRVATVRNGAGKWVVHFEQMANGLRVVDGRAHTVFTESGRLFVTGADIFPDVDVNPTPTLSEEDALAIAKGGVSFLDGRDAVYYRELVILPIRVESGELMELEYRLAWRFDLDVADPLGNWVTHVDAGTGEVLWRENWISTVDFTGHAQGDAEFEGECDGFTLDYPMFGMDVVVSGVGTATTDVNGDFTLPYGNTDTRTYTAEFLGPWIDIDRFTGTDAQLAGNITPGTPLTLDWAGGNSLPAERDCFAYVNKQHDWLLTLDPTFTEMDYQAPCIIERTDGFCPGNAWYSFGDRSINFCLEGSGFGNTGRLGDVVYHEYGHGVTHQVYLSSSQPRSSLHEGNSDIAANLLTNESIIGLGFFTGNCVSGIRNSDNTMQYPADWSDSHTGGQIIAGFIWDSWQDLQNTVAPAEAESIAANGWHFSRRLGLPQLEEDQVFWTFVADDDDGDLTNGTPNYASFCVGATNHGFTCPPISSPITISHTPVTAHTDESTAIEIAATITSTAASINSGALAVQYRVDGGGFSSVGMASTGGDGYSGFIPAQSAGAFVEYYIYAEDMSANSLTEPLLAPSSVLPFYVGDFTTVFSDDFETDKSWTAGIAGDDATTGAWELGDPEGTTNGGQLQPEDDHTPNPGTDCYATQLAAGASAGTFDIDGGTTTLLSPLLDLSGASVAMVRYWRWYSNNLGAAPGSDTWQVSVNDGTGWTDLENTMSSANSWNQFTFILESPVNLTSTMQFRFLASDLGDGSLVEAAMDDFELLAIFPVGISPDSSTIAATDNAMLCPAGDGDSVLTVTVTVIDGLGAPVAGIPAGDVVLNAAGVSSNGNNIEFCNGTPDLAQWLSTAATNASGEATFTITNVGGCGTITFTAEVQSIPLTSGAVVSIKSPDFNGDGELNFFDTFLYIPELMAGTGSCGNLNNDAAGDVNFFDTNKYLTHLITSHKCP